jgi:ATP-binding cassette subfamily F protein 3
MIYLKQLHKQYGPKILLSGVDFHLRPGEKVGLVGDNGMGKTTLFRIIQKKESADFGKVSFRKGIHVGMLDQHFEAGDQTALERTVMGDPYFSKIMLDKESLENDQTAHQKNPEKWEKQYGHLVAEFERLGGYERESKAKAILSGLGFKEEGWNKPLLQLSGGWAIRVELALLLLQNPDVLLLDEPSNHLDLRSVIWLENFLKSYEGSIVLISHDRRFLNKIVNRIVHLDRGNLSIYQGNFDDFEKQKEERESLLEQAALNQKKKINEMERFIERFRAKASKAKQAQSRVKALDKIKRIETTSESKSVRFRFPQPPRSGKVSIKATDIKKSYGKLIVYDGVSFEIERGSKIALVGENGAGKSTLLRILAGVLPVDSGEIALGSNVTRTYFAQRQSEVLDPKLTVLESISQVGPSMGRTQLQTILGGFRFSGNEVDKKTEVLSGGECSRLALARMLTSPASFLFLDEPTNHLDMKSCSVLAAALEDYEGTICVISHDRDFLDGFVNQVWEIDNGSRNEYPGSYSNYEWKKANEEEKLLANKMNSQSSSKVKEPKKSKASKREKAEVRNQLHKNKQPLKKKLTGLEDKLEKIMEEKGGLDKTLEDQEIYNEANKEKLLETLSLHKKLGSEENELIEEIERLTEKLETVG